MTDFATGVQRWCSAGAPAWTVVLTGLVWPPAFALPGLLSVCIGISLLRKRFIRGRATACQPAAALPLTMSPDVTAK
jgi:hypothetical protein